MLRRPPFQHRQARLRLAAGRFLHALVALGYRRAQFGQFVFQSVFDAPGLVGIVAQDIAHALSLDLTNLLCEQLQLQDSVRQSIPDLWICKCCNIPEPCFAQRLLTGLLHHPAVADEDHFFDGELLRQAEPQDLLKYGLIPEFVGRLPVLGVLDELDEAALIDILTRPRNAILKQYARLFEFEGVKVTWTDDAIREIAREALQRKVGARGLRMILEELMLDLMYHVPGNKKVKELVITEHMVRNREVTMPVMLEKAG